MASSNILTRKQHQKMSNDQLIGFAMKVQENLSPKKTFFPTEKKGINAKLHNIGMKTDQLKSQIIYFEAYSA